MGDGAHMLSSLGVAFVIFIIVAVAVMIALKLMLPFSIFKIKELAEESLDEQKKTNELLTSLLREIKKDIPEDSDDRERRKEPLN